MLKVGDIVKPKNGKLGNKFLFKIIETNLKDITFGPIKLRRIEQELNPINGPYNCQLDEIFTAESVHWHEHELDLIKPNKIELKGENKMDILDLYKERKTKSIHEKYNALIKEIKEADKIQEIIQETNRLIQDTDPSREFSKYVFNAYTTETEEDIADMEKACNIEINELNELIEEIQAYFTMTIDFSERKEILKNYNIIDKKGRLII